MTGIDRQRAGVLLKERRPVPPPIERLEKDIPTHKVRKNKSVNSLCRKGIDDDPRHRAAARSSTSPAGRCSDMTGRHQEKSEKETKGAARHPERSLEGFYVRGRRNIQR